MIVGVIDLLGGQAVHAIAGHRSEYRPVGRAGSSGVDVDGSPADLAALYRNRGVDALYVADLDAIAGRAPAILDLAAVAGIGLRMLVDAGRSGPSVCRELRDMTDGDGGLEAEVILATEWAEGPDDLGTLVATQAGLAPWVSLDLDGDRLWNPTDGWRYREPTAFWRDLDPIGAERWIVLDVGVVGTASGPRGLPALSRLRNRRPDATILLGGGIRDQADVDAAHAAGASGVLVATALLRGENLTWPGPARPDATAP